MTTAETAVKSSYHYTHNSTPKSSVILSKGGYGDNYYYKYDVNIPAGTAVAYKVWRASELYSVDSADFCGKTEVDGEVVISASVKGSDVVDKTVIIDKPITVLYTLYKSGDHSRRAYFDLTYESWQ